MGNDSDLLWTAQYDHIRTITLNRPDRHHALNFELASRIAAAVDEAEQDAETRVLIITGSGDRAFCAGQDMLEMSGVEPPAAQPKSSSAAIAFDRVAEAKMPVIAAINGYCYGGGALLALACDIRVASDKAMFRLPGAEYGLVVGAAWLPRLVGTSKAKELIFTARKFGAAEALECGFLSHVHQASELAAKAQELAVAIAANSPIAVRESKRVIDEATLNPAACELEAEINRVLRGSDEQRDRFKTATTRVTGKAVD